MDFGPTKKGLLRAEFEDRYGAVCSIQESSHAGEDCIWLGVEVDLEGNEVPRGRMHLSQEQARELIPVLRHFARTGRLGEDDGDPRHGFHVGIQALHEIDAAVADRDACVEKHADLGIVFPLPFAGRPVGREEAVAAAELAAVEITACP